MDSLFAYGTLLCEDIFFKVTGCRYRTSPGVLREHRRLRVRGEEYPGIIPGKGSTVQGTVYHDLPAAAWERLDIFEGDMYVRKQVRVELRSGGTCDAHAYIVLPEFEHLLEERQWSLEEFIRSGRKRFADSCKDFDFSRLTT